MKRPVFVVGCPRSGTTLLYSMLVAAGGFAFYRKETYFFDLLPRFPDLANPRSQDRFAAAFLGGYLGKVRGLDVAPLVRNALDQCRRSADFLPRLMEGITQAQEMDRWVEATPVHVLYIDEIRRAVPDALFLHVIRDGRDCAVSSIQQRWVRPLPWDRGRKLGVAALYWEWMVRAGRAAGGGNAGNYVELQFEDLVADPRRTLERVGRFIDHDLNYDRIQQNRVHALKNPNTSFGEERGRPDFNPVGRWKDRCSEADLKMCEALVGRALEELGYELAYPADARRPRPGARLMRRIYLDYFRSRHWLKARTPAGRLLTSTSLWAEQPREDEKPVRPIASHPAGPTPAGSAT